MSDMGEVALKRKKSNCGASLGEILFHLPKQDGRPGRAVPLCCLFRRCHACFAAHVRRILPPPPARAQPAGHPNPAFFGHYVVLVSVVLVAITGRWSWLAAGIVAAYGFAWVGHFSVEHNFVEHNRQATFQHPWFSLLGDFRLYADLWRGREKF